jgi:hypothetical protein
VVRKAGSKVLAPVQSSKVGRNMNPGQRRKLTAGIGMILMLLGAMVLAPAVAGANHDPDTGHNPRGNNGTVKLDGLTLNDGPGNTSKPNDPDDNEPDNDPHLDCLLQLEFFGFDTGQLADITFTAHPPTGEGGVLLAQERVLVSDDDAKGGATDVDETFDYSVSEHFGTSQFTDLHNQNGLHVMLDVKLFNSDGSEVPGGQKHKVFWVEQCVAEPTPTYDIELTKTNDADRDADSTFSDDETASEAGSDVAFQLDIVNHGDELTVTSLEDSWPGQTEPLDLLAEDVDLACTRDAADVTLSDPLPAGSTTTCSFTVEGYAPEAGESLVNTVVVGTDREGVGDEDTSTVRTPATSPAPTYAIEIDKVNDANDDGDFSDAETAEQAGDAVEFRITIANTGTGDLTLQSLVDEVPERDDVDLLDAALDCGDVTLEKGAVLAAGSTTVCTFELAEYAPEAGELLTNTVTVVADRGQASDTSTVDTPVVEVLPEAPAENEAPVQDQPTADDEPQAENPGAPQVEGDEQSPPPPSEFEGDEQGRLPATEPERLPVTEVRGDEQSRTPAPQVEGDVATATPAPEVKGDVVTATPAPEVKGDVVNRTLPRTGAGNGGVAAMGAFLVALGAAMVFGGRLRFRRIG